MTSDYARIRRLFLEHARRSVLERERRRQAEFYEPDEPVDKIKDAYDAGDKGLTSDNV